MTKPENMTTKTFITICAAAMLAACSGHCDRHAECNGQCAPADSMNIVLDLHRHVKPQYVAAFKAAFIECKQQTVKEPGCLDYGVYQAADDSTHLFIHEEWKNQAELDKHGQTAHLKKFVATTKDMCASKKDRRITVCPRVQAK